MTHPKSQPSAYQLTDFTLKGQRSATLQIDHDVDYVFQVIAREDKGKEYGIDYKYSDMVTSYVSGSAPGTTNRHRSSTRPTTTTTTIRPTTTTTRPTSTTMTTTTIISTYFEPQIKALTSDFYKDDFLDYNTVGSITHHNS